MRCCNLTSSIESVSSRHRAVHYHNVRLQFADMLQCLYSVTGLSDHGYRSFVVENTPESAPHQRVVIHKQNRDVVVHNSCRTGPMRDWEAGKMFASDLRSAGKLRPPTSGRTWTTFVL